MISMQMIINYKGFNTVVVKNTYIEIYGLELIERLMLCGVRPRCGANRFGLVGYRFPRVFEKRDLLEMITRIQDEQK